MCRTPTPASISTGAARGLGPTARHAGVRKPKCDITLMLTRIVRRPGNDITLAARNTLLWLRHGDKPTEKRSAATQRNGTKRTQRPAKPPPRAGAKNTRIILWWPHRPTGESTPRRSRPLERSGSRPTRKRCVPSGDVIARIELVLQVPIRLPTNDASAKSKVTSVGIA